MTDDDMMLRRRFAHALLSPLTVVLGAAEVLLPQAKEWPAATQELLELILAQGKRLRKTLEGLIAAVEVEGEIVRTSWPGPHVYSPETATTDAAPIFLPETQMEKAREPLSSITPEDIPQQPHILVVDDDASTRTILREVLQRRDYHVDLASNGVEAIDLARSHRPDVILLDIMMPGVNGLRMYTVFREDPSLAKVPIVIVSAAGEETLDTAVFPWIVPKPIRPEQLFQTVQQALGNMPVENQHDILIIDCEEAVRHDITEALKGKGYQVREATSGQEGLRDIARSCPDVVLLDLSLPDTDGLEVLHHLRRQSSTLTLPIILIATTDDPTVKARGLRLGADDFISKPFSTVELEARVETALRRKDLEYSRSPTTRLPGNIAVERALRRLLATGAPFAVCYADLDNFKAYNDVYGFLKGDGVIHQTARLLVTAVQELGNPNDFVGHVGGDDFVVVTTPDKAEAICQRAVKEFDQVIPLYYDAESRRLRYIESIDRHGHPARFPLMTITLVIVTNEGRAIEHPGQLVDLITELKQQAKRLPGSSILSL